LLIFIAQQYCDGKFRDSGTYYDSTVATYFVYFTITTAAKNNKLVDHRYEIYKSYLRCG